MKLSDDLARLVLEAASEAIGDEEFPLEVDLSQVDRGHEHVGKLVEISPHANDVLAPFIGERTPITGVFVKNSQIAAYEVKFKGKIYWAPKKDFYLKWLYVEDVWLHSARSIEVRATLAHWEGQRDYYGPVWDGVEAVCFELAKLTDTLAVEAPDTVWHKYPSSTREDPEGKDWRYVLKDRNGPVAVNCHSTLHDFVWTLATTVHNTRDIDPMQLNLIGAPEHWDRTIIWLVETMRVLSKQGFKYTAQKRYAQERLDAGKGLKSMRNRVLPQVLNAYKRLYGKAPKLPAGGIHVGYCGIRLEPDALALHEAWSDQRDYSILTVHPKVMKDTELRKAVLHHELIHYVQEERCISKTHGKEFHRMADELGLPKKYRD